MNTKMGTGKAAVAIAPDESRRQPRDDARRRWQARDNTVAPALAARRVSHGAPGERVWFAPLFLATGASLLIYVISGVSLLAAVALSGAAVAAVGTYRWRQLLPPERIALRRAVRAGVIAGALATAAYDGFRYVIIEVLQLSFWPFDIFTHFGRALVGAAAPAALVTASGIAFHIANGLCFATFYAVAFGRTGVKGGVAWALCLEVMMVSVYPGWLDIKILDEFLQVTFLGHVVYGSVLGYTARRLLTATPDAEGEERQWHQ